MRARGNEDFTKHSDVQGDARYVAWDLLLSRSPAGVGILLDAVRMAKSVKRSVLETTKPGTGGTVVK